MTELGMTVFAVASIAVPLLGVYVGGNKLLKKAEQKEKNICYNENVNPVFAKVLKSKIDSKGDFIDE